MLRKIADAVAFTMAGGFVIIGVLIALDAAIGWIVRAVT
jgi:hypothetical protein